ncbi:MAG: hypothetical protein ACRDRI_14725 [Pseudonocardiaceae bacterium]
MSDDISETQDQPGERAGEGKGAADEHPAWCSPEYCHVNDEGVRVHEQAPVVWEDETSEVLFDSRLVDPSDAEIVYVELRLKSLGFGSWFYGGFPLDTARRLRDQLTAHLDAAELS